MPVNGGAEAEISPDSEGSLKYDLTSLPLGMTNCPLGIT